MLLELLKENVKISYEISSIFFTLIIIIFMRMKSWGKGKGTTKSFRCMAYSGMIWNIVEVISPTLLRSDLNGTFWDAVKILIDGSQFTWGHVTLLAFVFYLEHYTSYKHKTWMRQLNVAILLFSTFAVVSNPVTHWVFTYWGPVLGYTKGPLYLWAGYMPAMVYGVYALFLYIRNFRGFILREKIALLGTILMVFLGSSLQVFFNGQIKITALFASYGLFILYLALETSDYLNLVSARSELEEARESANAASQAKSIFIASMSHEIRTPMNAILGINEMILKETKEEKTLVYAKDMKTSGETLLTIINDVLDISKMEAGRLEIRDDKYHLSQLIDELSYETREATTAKRLDFELNLDESLPDLLLGDKPHLQQVFHNLLDNAVKYTNRGKITFDIQGERDGEFVHLVGRVEDTGVGIKPNDIPTLFQNFHRVDLERNRSIEGTGLGLSLSKKILTLMGGRISVASQYEIGSIFTVEITQKVIGDQSIYDYRKEAGEYNPLTRKIENVEDKRFLVVDDNEMNLKVAKAFLASSGAEIITEQDSVKALELIKTEHFDLIFLDDLMPRLNGSAIMTRVKRAESGVNKETPIIVMTANSTGGEEEKYLEMGFDGYVAKPVKEDKLVEVVNRFV
ncbi:MAG: response regulator [Lachnospiraceae bacterium]|nr:response regulator [Lachnospiraceae bacterium]